MTHWFQIGKKLDVFSLVVCPDDGIVVSAPDEDGDRDDDQVEGIIECGVKKINHIDSILRDCILNAVESDDEKAANDKLGYDEEKVDRQLIENKKILSVFPAQASMVGVVDADGWEEDPHSSDEVRIQRSRRYG